MSPQQRYSQVNDNFLKSDHPAVARTKPRLSSLFPIAIPAFGSPLPVTVSFPPDPYNQSSSPGGFRQEADTQEAITSYNEYIIPIPDPKPEEVFTDEPSESPARYGAMKRCCRCEPNAGVARKMRMYLLNKSSVFFPPHTHSSRCGPETIAVLWRLSWRHVFIAYINMQPGKLGI